MIARPDSKHCLAFPTASTDLVCWVEADGEPGVVTERRKNGSLATGTIMVKPGAELLIRHGDFRDKKPYYSYVTGYAVDGKVIRTEITSKADSFWSAPPDDASRFGSAHPPKFSSDPKTQMVITVGLWRIAGLQYAQSRSLMNPHWNVPSLTVETIAQSAPPSSAPPPTATDLAILKTRKPAALKTKVVVKQTAASPVPAFRHEQNNQLSSSSRRISTSRRASPATPVSASSTLLDSSSPTPFRRLTDIDAAVSDQEDIEEHAQAQEEEKDAALEREKKKIQLELEEVGLKRKMLEIEEEIERRVGKKRKV
ncbi:hypothetical protein JCM11251_000249 [Rhodosporidiobolus azoricus]